MSIAMYLPAMTRELLTVTNTNDHTVLFSDQQPYNNSIHIADTVVDSAASKLAKTHSGKQTETNSSRLPPSSPLPPLSLLLPLSPLTPLPSPIAAENRWNYASSESSSSDISISIPVPMSGKSSAEVSHVGSNELPILSAGTVSPEVLHQFENVCHSIFEVADRLLQDFKDKLFTTHPSKEPRDEDN